MRQLWSTEEQEAGPLRSTPNLIPFLLGLQWGHDLGPEEP